LNSPELEAKLSRYALIDNESRELSSILSTAQTQTHWLDSRPIKANPGKGAINFSLLKKRPTTIYLTRPARRLGTHATWLRVTIASIIQPLLKDTRDDAEIVAQFRTVRDHSCTKVQGYYFGRRCHAQALRELFQESGGTFPRCLPKLDG
jgi:hypothetical protein